MPDVTINIGGRSFIVACQPGEEPYLQSASGLLDTEAQKLSAAGARLTQDRMLLMAGLMLADKSISLQEDVKKLEAELATQQGVIEELQARGATAAAPAPDTGLQQRLEDFAGRAEALAEKAEGVV
ncbi:cell division protein ZapA [Thalassobacter stenotrophicus]|jgi:cell division protein ZapA|uniref:Cell division protein ZapA n=2 Tax=Thalassobacter stenotrophicus TaxID=266809 RepID=A0A0P1EX27_9RHOB|nr:cell division protein ZapA [Thalassobacter stenotrophicus]PVZ47761.1 cell division protein ZapA [Thalassobacter stenotrophicus]UYP68975.1 cell division protein ZapA [Thalassobacter stenotrophicus]CUH59571.1 Cell division protein ZapA [Thalassobacter stenotrophicus]SHI80595.1 cell division protein ZapA [Thalassobacter stenotrophicus DSM 16310]